jgi:hypothetical protein
MSRSCILPVAKERARIIVRALGRTLERDVVEGLILIGIGLLDRNHFRDGLHRFPIYDCAQDLPRGGVLAGLEPGEQFEAFEVAHLKIGYGGVPKEFVAFDRECQLTKFRVLLIEPVALSVLLVAEGLVELLAVGFTVFAIVDNLNRAVEAGVLLERGAVRLTRVTV